jgi:hypothetical protein
MVDLPSLTPKGSSIASVSQLPHHHARFHTSLEQRLAMHGDHAACYLVDLPSLTFSVYRDNLSISLLKG